MAFRGVLSCFRGNSESQDVCEGPRSISRELKGDQRVFGGIRVFQGGFMWCQGVPWSVRGVSVALRWIGFKGFQGFHGVYKELGWFRGFQGCSSVLGGFSSRKPPWHHLKHPRAKHLT